LSDAHGSNPIDGGADRDFAGFQVHMPRLAPATEEDVQPLAYLAGDLFRDRGPELLAAAVNWVQVPRPSSPFIFPILIQ
jgi:hypothetical protein